MDLLLPEAGRKGEQGIKEAMAEQFLAVTVDAEDTPALLEQSAPLNLHEKRRHCRRLMGRLLGDALQNRFVCRAAKWRWLIPSEFQRTAKAGGPRAAIRQMPLQHDGDIGLDGVVHGQCRGRVTADEAR